MQLRMCSPSPGIRTCRAFMNPNESPLVMYNSMKGKSLLSFGRRWRKNQNSRGVQQFFFFIIGANVIDATLVPNVNSN